MPVYGINTGFGQLATIRIPRDQVAELQRNLITSHSAGVGDSVPTEVCRAILLLREWRPSSGRARCWKP